MRGILEDIKRGSKGVVGSFIIEKRNGNPIISDLPELLIEEIKKVSFNLSLLSSWRKLKSIDKIQISAEEGNIVARCDENYILACITSNDVNIGFLHILLRKSLNVFKSRLGG